MKAVINAVLTVTLFWGIGVINVHAQTCNENIIPTTPSERFLDNGDGTVTDKHTALVWMRCSLGQTWDGTTCAGDAAKYAWQEALHEADVYTYAGSSAWRVPNKKQLQSVVERSCYDPAINLDIFPQTPDFAAYFWTASRYGYDDYNAWMMVFGRGVFSQSNKSGDFYVRLVRPDTIDEDGDGVLDESDNCVLYANPDQLNTDGDAQGNACDADDDNDGIPDAEDPYPLEVKEVTVTISGIAQIQNGSITPTQPLDVNQGGQIVYTVIADAGYYPHIFGCGGSFAGTEYTINKVVDNCTITLIFKLPAPLNDTGITRCGNADDNDLDCAQADFPGQDAEYGRDVTDNNDSDGHAGFNFTKICNSGEAAGEGGCTANPSLGAGANQWACTRDNVTGLMWEVKTDDGGLRDKDNTYSWYNPDSGGGQENGGTCPDAGNCDTEKYVISINAAGLCGYNDWRIPQREELRSIINYGSHSPSIDTAYFPNTVSQPYTSVSPSIRFNDRALYISFSTGKSSLNNRYEDSSRRLRLMRADSD